MIRRKIKSALFIDFDNIVQIVGREFAESVPHWLAWLEDGQFEEFERKRVFETKHVYWNSHNEVHRKTFESWGFEAQTCPHRIRSKKSSADMVIAIDVIETIFDKKNIEEFVLLSTDTDFVTLVDKLGEFDKKAIVSANERIPTVYTVFSDHADGVIPMYALREAMKYERTRKSFSGFLKSKSTTKVNLLTAADADANAADVPDRDAKPAARAKTAATRAPKKVVAKALHADQLALLEVVGEHLAQMARSAPGLPLGRGTVIRALEKRVPQFKTSGAFGFLGCGSYARMIERIAANRTELQLIKYKDGGMVIVSPAGSEAQV
jgi:uncharacterized LabA/DUF88 family protein